MNQKPELPTHPIVVESLLYTRDELYGGRTEAMRFHYKALEKETIQYVDFMSLYPYIWKYYKFPIVYPIIHVWDSCKDRKACRQMESLIKCSIVRPIKFYHPVLPLESTIKYFVYAFYAFTKGTFPVNASILEMMRGPLLELGFWTRFD